VVIPIIRVLGSYSIRGKGLEGENLINLGEVERKKAHFGIGERFQGFG